MGAEIPAGMTNPLDKFRDQVAVIVSSYDGFFDAWRPFAFFFRKFWPDCPLPLYLITNHLEVQSQFIRGIRVGADHGWASNMQQALQHIRTPYIFYLQEDYFLTAPVDAEQLARDFDFALQQNADCFHFVDLALMEPEFRPANPPFAVVPQESQGRTRLQAALWKRAAVESLLLPGEDAWNMEARGNARSRDLLIYSYGPNELPPLRYLISGIVRGLWTPEALALFREHGFTLRPRFRLEFQPHKWQQRWRRAWGRAVLPLMHRIQRRQPIDL
jgi:hypothetical protein